MAQLQYIYNNSDAQFNIPISGMNTIKKVEFKWSYQNVNPDGYQNHLIRLGGDFGDFVIRRWDNQFDIYWYNISAIVPNPQPQTDEIVTCTYDVTNSVCTWNGTDYQLSGTQNYAGNSMQLGGNDWLLTVYYIKMWDANGNLIHHYVGWNEDNTIGMKDKVIDRFYSPSSGTFLGGPVEILPEDLVIGNKTVDSITFLNKDVVSIYNGQTLLWEKPVRPAPYIVNFAESVTLNTECPEGYWRVENRIDTGIPHESSTMTVRVKYKTKCYYSDRIVGYTEGDPMCLGDDNDFRVLSDSDGTYDYSDYRSSSQLGIFSEDTYYDITIGDCFVYDNINEQFIVNETPRDVVPSEGCHIYADVSGIYLYEVIIEDGNTTLFDGVAAYDSEGHIGLYDTVNNTMCYNPIIPMTYKPKNELFHFEALTNNSKIEWPSTADLEVSDDGITWDSCNSVTMLETDAGDKVYFRKVNNTGGWGLSPLMRKFFNLTGNYKIAGTLSSLIGIDSGDTIQGQCGEIFHYCNGLVDASDFVLDVELGNVHHAFYGMFRYCPDLEYAPKILPSTELVIQCYEVMFEDCTSLETAPILPATTLVSDCYRGMFAGCSSLTTPPELPATTLAANCYDTMFRNCASLQTVPELPATTLAEECYAYMFDGCSSITTAPFLPASTPVTNSYYYMFNNCSSLNSVSVAATYWPYSHTENSFVFLRNVSPTGTFTKLNTTYIQTGVDGIPSGWTVNNITSVSAPTAINTESDCFRRKMTVTIEYQGVVSILCRYANDDEGEDINDSDWFIYTGPFELGFASYRVQAKAVFGNIQSMVFTRFNVNYNCPCDEAESYGDCVCQEYQKCPDCENDYTYFGYSSHWECDCAENDHCVDCGTDWESEGFESYEDCECQVNGEFCPTDCNNWEDMGYGSYEDCDCGEYGNCPPDPCQDCIDSCSGDPDCEEGCFECESPCNNEPCGG